MIIKANITYSSISLSTNEKVADSRQSYCLSSLPLKVSFKSFICFANLESKFSPHRCPSPYVIFAYYLGVVQVVYKYFLDNPSLNA